MGRRKTVRELLQERKQTLSKQTNNKIRREIRVLRPILKLPVNTFCQSTTTPTITNVSKLNEASSSTNSTTNILVKDQTSCFYHHLQRLLKKIR
ncbi:hypothetical protein CEXT_749811 [Caerostris extrusa]|uniref:Uncharacterized protein n=1 Tax=Caerostris extrusa TaxID=172846 RepID=A0AAV4SKQ9_CAEEX|nr:hypothetical protein CEXT_749811 [Caerostris extrusa]